MSKYLLDLLAGWRVEYLLDLPAIAAIDQVVDLIAITSDYCSCYYGWRRGFFLPFALYVVLRAACCLDLSLYYT